MRILIVDDSNARVSRIIEFLSLPEASVVVCSNTQDARDKMCEEQFDLLLLDILIPRRSWENADAEHSMEMLTEIVETSNLIKPKHIVGMTAYSEAADLVSQKFTDRTWTILRADELSNDWLDQLRNCVSYIDQENEQAVPRRHLVDLLVLTALRDPEMSAVHRLPWNWRAEEPLDDVSFFRRGSFRSGAIEFSVISAVAPRMGMVPMALLAAKMFSRFQPRVAVMPGICAGVRNRAQLGDVIFADLSWDYQSGKHFVDEQRVSGFQSDPYPVLADQSLAGKVEQLSLDMSVWTSIWQAWPDRPPNPPRLITGPVGSGAAVLADSKVTEKIVEQQRKVRGIEMEIYAMYLAAEYLPKPRPIVVGMKAVCDFADETKADGHQNYAAYVSASAMQAFFERNMEPLIA